MKTSTDNLGKEPVYVDSSEKGWTIVSASGKKLSGYYENCKEAMQAARSFVQIQTLKDIMHVKEEIYFR